MGDGGQCPPLLRYEKGGQWQTDYAPVKEIRLLARSLGWDWE